MQMRFLMLVVSLAVMGIISQSKTYRGNHRGRSPQKVTAEITAEITVEGHRRFEWTAVNQPIKFYD